MPMLLADSPASVRYGKERFWFGFVTGVAVGGIIMAVVVILATLWP